MIQQIQRTQQHDEQVAAPPVPSPVVADEVQLYSLICILQLQIIVW